ncbi:MAG: hypothetical protein HYT77_08845 [Deltaproteobacteria bacterium]|nr:hypothetical protein [Deltaproteobacteria bacterium]
MSLSPLTMRSEEPPPCRYLPDNTHGSCEIKGTVIEFDDPLLVPIARYLTTYPTAALINLTPSGRLQLINLERKEFVRRFPRDYSRPEHFYWEPDHLYLQEAEKWDDNILNTPEFLEPLRKRVDPKRRPSLYWVSRDENSLFISPSLKFYTTELVREFVTQGFTYHLPPYLYGELRMVQTASEEGKSLHQLRFRATNPEFNRWFDERMTNRYLPFDPNLRFYAGALTTVGTNPFGILTTLTGGADSEITSFRKNKIILDTNIQYRVRSSEKNPADGLGFEWTPRIESEDRSWSLGLSIATNVDGVFRGGIVARGKWD